MDNKILKRRVDNYMYRTDILTKFIAKAIEMHDEKGYTEVSEEDKKRAAYALNMCMVSVSQIVDYKDINILEQEYEAILNNLNLEKIPKDDALLHILKQLLDTITYFKIQEGDKKLIEKEYQHKVKNAIWNAIPSFGLLVSTVANPASMLLLASQIGTGYMNYRRSKAENELEYEKKQWQLQRSAIEQFNALRRELFDTAWRLADTYNFPDEYRLTERQIKQYNAILMDSDEIRKYERLKSIEDKFTAYPAFWYYIGNTANYIAANIVLNDDSKKKFRETALRYFQKYNELNKYSILREDQMAAACALEHVEILLIKEKEDNTSYKKEIEQLLDSAVRKAGNALDIIQICAIHYLHLNSLKNAEKYLRILVNEDYNTIINAQLLSRLYVAFKNRHDYELLEKRIGKVYLYPMPSKENENEKLLEEKFYNQQRNLLKKKYQYLFKKFEDDAKNDMLENLSLNDKFGNKLKLVDKKTFESKKDEILVRLKNGMLQFKILNNLNDYLDCYFELPYFKSNKNELQADQKKVLEQLKKDKIDKINELQEEIDGKMNQFTYDRYSQMLEYSPKEIIPIEFIDHQIFKSIDKCKIDIVQTMDTELMQYCDKAGIKLPNYMMNDTLEALENDVEKGKLFDISIFGNDAKITQEVENLLPQLKTYGKMYYDNNPSLIKHSDDTQLYSGDKLRDYFVTKPKILPIVEKLAIMVIEDKRKKENEDLIILPYRVLLVKKGEIRLIHKDNTITVDDERKIVIDKGWVRDDTLNNPSIDGNLLVRFSEGLKGKLKSVDTDLNLKDYVDNVTLKK